MLNFIDKLDEEQAANAEKVANAARRAGVDPRLAVAIAFQESKLRSNPPRGADGEIGMMQVMPTTGKGLGFDEKQLSNLDQNIEAGIKYLKQGLEATGNDSQLAAIYYNGGPNAIQAMTSGKEPNPKVFDYLRSVGSYGTFQDKQEQPPAEAEKPPEVVSTAESDAQRDLRIQAALDAQEKRMGQIYGGAVGAGLTGVRIGKGAAESLATSLGQASETGRIAAQARAGLPAGGMPPAAPGAAPMAPPGAPQSVVRVQPPGGGLIQLGTPGTYSRAEGPGSGLFNYGRSAGLTEIEAGRALDMTKQAGGAHDLLTKRREALMDIRSRFPSETFVENPRFGGIMTPDQGVGGGPRASYVSQPPTPAAPGQPPQAGGLRTLPPRQAIPTAPPAPSGLQTVTRELRSLVKPVVSGMSAAGRYVVPPLALAGAGGEAADVMTELKKADPDYIKALLSGVTGLSGLAAVVPPLTLPATAIGGTAALINYLREEEKERSRLGQNAPSIQYVAP